MPLSSLAHLVRTSRPRFWLYVAGPYLLAITPIAKTGFSAEQTALAIAWGLWLLFPANLFLYGVNDLHDRETDALNQKKAEYESRLSPTYIPTLVRAVRIAAFIGGLLSLTTLILLPAAWVWALLGSIGFLALGHQYSALPVRAKARPFLDSVSNVLYIVPVFLAWSLKPETNAFPWLAFFAGALWCMAMHAFSAVPDIRADKQARLETIATRLGASRTIAVCAILYLAACLLPYSWIGWLSVVGGAMYGTLMLLAWRWRANEKRLFVVYTWFPWINALVGFGLWLRIYFL